MHVSAEAFSRSLELEVRITVTHVRLLGLSSGPLLEQPTLPVVLFGPFTLRSFPLL